MHPDCLLIVCCCIIMVGRVRLCLCGMSHDGCSLPKMSGRVFAVLLLSLVCMMAPGWQYLLTGILAASFNCGSRICEQLHVACSAICPIVSHPCKPGCSLCGMGWTVVPFVGSFHVCQASCDGLYLRSPWDFEHADVDIVAHLVRSRADSVLLVQMACLSL